jgi:hypothetical protein
MLTLNVKNQRVTFLTKCTIRKKYGLIGTPNTEKIRLPVVQYGKNNVRSHVLNGWLRLD